MSLVGSRFEGVLGVTGGVVVVNATVWASVWTERWWWRIVLLYYIDRYRDI